MTVDQLQSLEDRVRARNRTDALIRKRTITIEADDFEILVRELKKLLMRDGGSRDRR